MSSFEMSAFLCGENFDLQRQIEVMPEESKNAAFYEKHGFKRMEDAAALQICNFSNKI